MASSLRSKGRSINPHSRVLLHALLSISVLAIIGGSYWQQQLLKSSNAYVDTASALLQHWEEGLLQQQQSTRNVTNNTKTALQKNDVEVIDPLQVPVVAAETNSLSNNSSDAAIVIDDHNDSHTNKSNATLSSIAIVNDTTILPSGFQSVLQRSRANRDLCEALPKQPLALNHSLTVGNETKLIADLPDFGIISALENYTSSLSNDDWQCQVPPPTECNETQFTVVFMGYNPDRLSSLKRQVFSMTNTENSPWTALVKEVILVWNGERSLNETGVGQQLLQLSQERVKFRISFPLLEGFPNDLMNRYHPRLNITTRAILFYDDDGPFYSYNAILGGFELWKRHANAQIGAMARKIDLLQERQVEEESRLELFNDHAFVSHCRAQGDSVRYNFHEFATYHARMVLPSGSFLHSNYLCFLWHPALEEVRKFVRAHPVHPDDITVSTIVSHVAGRAPKVYSRRINAKKNETRRRLTQVVDEPFPRRRLLWQDVSKHDWAAMRSMAINSLVSYFGGVNSGSIGWCHDTPFMTSKKRRSYYCKPEMADIGMLPWMTEEHKPKDTCP